MHFGAENFSTALEYFHAALNESDIPAFPDKFRLLVRISDCHRKKGRYSDAEKFLAAARGLLDDPAPPVELGSVEYRDAYLRLARGDVHAGQRLAFSAYRRLKNTNEHREVAGVQTLIGHYYLRAGLLNEAEEFFSDALSSYRRVDDRIGIAYAYNNLGLLHKNSCRWKRALASLSKSLDIAKTIGLTQHLILVQLNLGVVYGKLRRFNDAISSFSAAINSAERFGDQLNLTRALLMTGRTLTQMGTLAKAEKSLLRAQAMAEELGYSRESALADEYLGDLMLARGEYDCALVNLEASLTRARRIAPEGDVVAECLRRIADAQYHRNRPVDAVKAIDEGIRVAESCGEVYELGYFYRTLGRSHARLGDPAAAVEALEKSIETFSRYSNPYEKAVSQQLLARTYIRVGDEPSLLKARVAVNSSISEFAALEEDHDQIVSQALLANIEQRLGNFDDALLAVYEADRLAEQEHTRKFRRGLQALRSRIETRMSTSSTRVLDQFSVLGDIQSGARSRDHLVKGLDSTLGLILEHLGARSGFVAIPPASGRGLSVVAMNGMDRKEAQAIESWYSSRETGGVHVITDLEHHADAADLRGRMSRPSGALLLQSLGFEGENLGVLCVHQPDAGGHAPLGHEALHFVAAYSSLISLSIFELVRSERKGRRRSRTAGAAKGFQSIVTENKEMIKLLNLAERVAHSDATVLLQGETGTGKGLIAYAVHLLSERREKRFVHVNCAALPEQLLESELFGHVRGSFTGAHADKVGLLQQADGGTIFLDEIGKTSLAMQGKLLQFLDSSRVRKVGSNDLNHVDVRVVCASKANLLKMCQDGRFLEDFFYRINDFPLTIPPLRDRVEDIPLLVDHYVDKIAREMDRVIDGVSDEFLAALETYRWPGNVRELEKIIKRAVILADDGDALGMDHLAPEVQRAPDPSLERDDDEQLTLKERIERIEHVEIMEALRRHDGNKSQAAIQLGISYPSLLSKIKRYHIQ